MTELQLSPEVRVVSLTLEVDGSQTRERYFVGASIRDDGSIHFGLAYVLDWSVGDDECSFELSDHAKSQLSKAVLVLRMLGKETGAV
jgi:hypothetical protein